MLPSAGAIETDGEESDACASTSDITITGGQIKAGSLIETKEEYHQPEYSGAGIGGGYMVTAMPPISPSPAMPMYTAAGGYYAAGIGGGDDGNATNITISGNAKVAAIGSNSGGCRHRRR